MFFSLFAKQTAGARLLFAIGLLVLLNGCAGRLNKASQEYYAGQPREALTLLDKGESFGNRNELLFLMEKGLVLHQLGNYRQSAEQLLQAAQLIDQFYYISLSEQASALAVNDWLTRYKGEYSERLWVHSYLMMDFLLLGEYDSALVEAKQALKVLGRHQEALKDAYFTRALIALCFANLGEDNDAYLEYRKLAQDLPDPAPVARDIVNLAGRLGMPDEVEKYRPYVTGSIAAEGSELVLFVANGRIPRKQPGNFVLPPSIRFSFPYYQEQHTVLPWLRIEPPAAGTLQPLSSDLGLVAQASLEARRLEIVVRETARAAAKEAAAQSVGKDHGSAAEIAVRLGLLLLEEPDVRCWQTLPGRLTLLRIPLAPGSHHLTLRVSGGPGGDRKIPLPDIELRAGQRVFRSIRW